MSLRGKNVLVTGSNRGLGRAIAEDLAQNGANVIAHARKETSEFSEWVQYLAKVNNIEVMPLYFDLVDEVAVKAAFQSLISKKLSLDVLVNNAGVPYGGLISATPIAKLREVFEVNFFAQIRLMQLAAKLMTRQRKGVIINMASVGGIETNPGYLAYGSSKAALIWATKCAAKEFGPLGIRVNAVAPGLVKTDMGFFKNEIELNKTIERTSLKRMGEKNEIAAAVRYLASDEAGFVTGHVLVVDGGRSV